MDYKKHLSLTMLVHVILCYNLVWHVAFMLNLNLMQPKHNGGLKYYILRLKYMLVGEEKWHC